MSKNRRNNEKYSDFESPFEDLVTPKEIEQGYTQQDVDLILKRKRGSIKACPRGTKELWVIPEYSTGDYLYGFTSIVDATNFKQDIIKKFKREDITIRLQVRRVCLK